MRHLILSAFAVALFAACSNDAEPVEYGTLRISLDDEPNVEVTQTRTTDADAFTVTIKKGSGTKLSKTYSTIANTDLVFETGSDYSASAESCTEDAAQAAYSENKTTSYGQQRFYGESGTFEIKSGETTSVTIACSMANSGVKATVDESFTTAFGNTYTIYVYTSDTNKADFTSSTIADNTAYFSAGQKIYYKIVATHSGSEKTYTGTLVESSVAKSIYSLNISASKKGDITLNITVDKSTTDVNENVSVDPYQE